MSTVLIVDDEALVRTSLRRLVEREGHRVVEAADGRAALSVVRTERPDVILTDIFMPDMDGLELVRHMRSAQPDVLIIAMSGGGVFPAPSVLAPASALGATAVLQKPFDIDELRSHLSAPGDEEAE